MTRPYLVIDSETALITDTCKAPPLSCVSYASPETGAGLLGWRDGLELYADALSRAAAGELLLIGHFFVYDLAVAVAEEPCLLPLVFAAYERGAIWCTKEAQKLIDLADGRMKYILDPETGAFRKGEHSLEALSRRCLGREMVDKKGEGAARLNFGPLRDVPLEQWEERMRRYAVVDAVNTEDLFLYQVSQAGRSPVVGWTPDGNPVVTDLAAQLRAGWSLYLSTCWGIGTDPERAAVLKARLVKEEQEAIQELAPKKIFVIERYKRTGFVNTKEGKKAVVAGQVRDIHKNMVEIQGRVMRGFAARGLDPPMTESWEKEKTKENPNVLKFVSYSEEALRDSGDPDLAVLADSMEGSKILSTYVPYLENGEVHPSYNLILETGRASSFGPSIQVLPREMETDPRDTVRGCFRARPGYLYSASDYEQVELAALAEVCLELFGWSRLAEIINSDLDVHLIMAIEKLNLERLPRGEPPLTYEEALVLKKDKQGIVARTRQIAKGPDYGVPGGMGIAKLVDYVKSQPGKHTITVEEAKLWKAILLSRLPEWKLFFDWNSRFVGEGDATFTQPISGRVRGGMSYTQLCNGHFQQRVADGAKNALWLITRECYTGWMLEDFPNYQGPRYDIPYHVHPRPPKGRVSPLYGSRVVAFVHDEIVLEVPEDQAHEAAMRHEHLMLEGMRPYINKVKVKAPAALCRYLYKGAEAVYGPNGKLIPWEPKEKKA